MDDAKVRVGVDGGDVLVVTIDRPEVLNCVDGDTAYGLDAAWTRLRDDPALRAGVITGAGTRAFSTGADLTDIPSLAGRDTSGGHLGGTRRLDVPKPLVAAVEGHCLAGGLELACMADLRVAGGSATFGLVNRRWNVPLVDGGTQRLPRIVGLGRALELILTGRAIDAATAHTWGLVNEVVPDGEALGRALEVAHGIARFPRESLLADRAATFGGLGRTLEEGLALEARLGGAVIEDPAFAEGVARFRDRPR